MLQFNAVFRAAICFARLHFSPRFSHLSLTKVPKILDRTNGAWNSLKRLGISRIYREWFCKNVCVLEPSSGPRYVFHWYLLRFTTRTTSSVSNDVFLTKNVIMAAFTMVFFNGPFKVVQIIFETQSRVAIWLRYSISVNPSVPMPWAVVIENLNSRKLQALCSALVPCICWL